MKTNKLHKYVKSSSKYAKKRGYSGYVEAPDGGREWVDYDKQGEKKAREKNETLITMGAKAYAYFTSNPSIMDLIWNIIAILKVMGMTLEDLYSELKAKATTHIFGDCLNRYLQYVIERFHDGIGSKKYIATVRFAINHMPPSYLAMNISQIKSEDVKKLMLSWTVKGGVPMKKSSLKTALDVYRSSLTIIANVKPEHNPFIFSGFTYKPDRGFVTVEQWHCLLEWWFTYELRNFAYFLHRGFLGWRHQQLVGKTTFDQALQKEVWTHTVLNRHLLHDSGMTRADDTKTGEVQIGYWPPAMCAWMKLVPKGDPNESIMGKGRNSDKAMCETAIELLLKQSWIECFGRKVPYIKNWMRHSPATYVSAMWGPNVAATYIGDDVDTIKKHYDGRAEKKQGIRYLNSYPPGFKGKKPDLWDWWKHHDDRDRK